MLKQPLTMLYANISATNAPLVSPPTLKSDGIVKPLDAKVATVEVVLEKPPPAPQSPVDFLKALFSRNEHGSCLLANLNDNMTFARPSKEATDAYDLTAVQAIRYNDMDKLREMLREGKSFNACNRFGESLIHMVCRRGNIEIARFLIKEACVDVNVKDDFGRTPMHDACWTSKPNVAIMDLLLDHVSPEMLLAEDVRGHTPFNYARKEHYEEWTQYLRGKEEDLQRRITTFGLIR